MPREQRDVVAAFAQRRQGELDHAQAVIEVLAKLAGAALVVEILVGGGDDAHVDADGLGVAQARDGAFLQRAQQLGLQLERHLVDLVEKDGAAVGELELADLAALARPREGAAAVAEDLGLHQVARYRRAVERDEGAVAPRRAVVDGLGKELFSGARLAQDQHARVLLRRRPRELDLAQQGRRFADDVVEDEDRVQAGESAHLLEELAPLAQGEDRARDGPVGEHLVGRDDKEAVPARPLYADLEGGAVLALEQVAELGVGGEDPGDGLALDVPRDDAEALAGHRVDVGDPARRIDDDDRL